MREADISIIYNSNLTQMKSDWDSFLNYTKANQPTITGTTTPGASGPAVSFGGVTSATGIGGYAAVAAVNQDLASRMAQSAASLPSGGVMASPYYAPIFGPGASPAYPAQYQGSYAQYSGGPLPGSPPPPGAGVPWFSRRGIQSFLGHEGLRGMGRYIGAYGIANFAEHGLSQQNQFGMSMAAASTYGDAIDAEIGYQKNSPLGSIPFSGGLGASLREFGTGDLAYLSGLRSNQEYEAGTGRIGSQMLSARYSSAASVAATRGDFAGRRESTNLTTQGNILANQMEMNEKVTALTSDLHGIKQLTPTPISQRGLLSQLGTAAMYVGSFGMYDRNQVVNDEISQANEKAADIQARIAAERRRSTEYGAQQWAQNAADNAATARLEQADIIGSASRTRAFGIRFGDERGAEREGIRGGYLSRIAATSDQGEKNRLAAEMSASLGAEDQQYGRDNNYLSQDTQISATRLSAKALSSTHRTLAATLMGIKSQMQQADLEFDKNTAGLDTRDPKQLERFNNYATQRDNARWGLTAEAIGARNDYAFDTSSMAGSAYAGGLRASGSSLAAVLYGNQLKQSQSTYYDPDRAGLYGAVRGVDDANARFENYQSHASVGYDIEARNRNIDALAYSGDMMPRSAAATSEINSDRLSAQMFNLTHPGPEWANERAANTQNLIATQRQSFQNLQFQAMIPGNAQEVSGNTFFGNFANVGYHDFQNALNISQRGGQQIQNASDQADQGIAPDLQQITQSIERLSVFVQQAWGVGG